jgi:hypothetical protein
VSNESCFPETANLSLWLLKLKEQRLCRAPRGALAWRYPSALGGALGMVVRFSVLFHALDERKWGQPMTEENFYITDAQGKKVGPLSAREIGELRRRHLIAPNSVVTDAAGALQTNLHRFDTDDSSNYAPPPPIPPLEDRKVSVAGQGLQTLRRIFLTVLIISAIKLFSWLFSAKKPQRGTGASSFGPPKWKPTPLTSEQLERFYPQETRGGERP